MRPYHVSAPRLRKLASSALLILFSIAIADAQPPVNRAAVLDFDGDGKTDYAIVRYTPILGGDAHLDWYILGSRDGFIAHRFGFDATSLHDRLLPRDYDGDGKWDIAVRRQVTQQNIQASFKILLSTTRNEQNYAWGLNDDNSGPTQDFDGDGKADPTVTRPIIINGNVLLYWYTFLSQTNSIRAVHFGTSGDAPIGGDFDGDGKADIAVERREFNSPTSTYFILRSSDGQVETFTMIHHQDGYFVPADFDGDGKSDIAIVRPENEYLMWYWRQSSDGVVRLRQFGLATDFPALGDYDGDGKTDAGVTRIVNGLIYFFVDRSRDGFTAVQWGRCCGDRDLIVHSLIF